MQIVCFQNFVRILLKYTTLIFSQIFDNLKKKVVSSSLPCAAGNIVVLDGINSLGMFWLCHFPNRLCPHPNVLLTHICTSHDTVMHAIKRFTFFLP